MYVLLALPRLGKAQSPLWHFTPNLPVLVLDSGTMCHFAPRLQTALIDAQKLCHIIVDLWLVCVACHCWTDRLWRRQVVAPSQTCLQSAVTALHSLWLGQRTLSAAAVHSTWPVCSQDFHPIHWDRCRSDGQCTWWAALKWFATKPLGWYAVYFMMWQVRTIGSK